MLKAQVNKDCDDWDDLIPVVLQLYNSAVHSTHGNVPFTLMFGRRPNMSSNCPLALAINVQSDEGIEGLKRNMRRAQLWARNNTLLRQVDIKAQYDKKAQETKLKVGDPVWFKNKGVKDRLKLAKDFSGPFLIYSVNSPNAVIYKPTVDGSVPTDQADFRKVHLDKLSAAKPESLESGEGIYPGRQAIGRKKAKVDVYAVPKHHLAPTHGHGTRAKEGCSAHSTRKSGSIQYCSELRYL
jgi:hypothetical protein